MRSDCSKLHSVPTLDIKNPTKSYQMLLETKHLAIQLVSVAKPFSLPVLLQKPCQAWWQAVRKLCERHFPRIEAKGMGVGKVRHPLLGPATEGKLKQSIHGNLTNFQHVKAT